LSVPPAQKSWVQIVRWKLVVAAAVGAALWVVSGQVGFPEIFQWMFAGYALLGFVVFVILDAPAMKTLSGWRAGIGIIVFYLICSALYVAASSFLPQFQSENEVEGIARKMEKFTRSAEMNATLEAKTKELSTKADEVLAKLNELRSSGASMEDIGTVEVPKISLDIPIKNLTPEQLVERGKLVFKDHECYNCHKVGGHGGKKRGPKLDNIGNLVTKPQLKDKIFHPTHWQADGFEERKKDKMPDKYPDVMTDDELEALTSYLVTLKDPSVDTPKPIFPPDYSVK
jgi:mono/diheme cytochrome c family protein